MAGMKKTTKKKAVNKAGGLFGGAARGMFNRTGAIDAAVNKASGAPKRRATKKKATKRR